MKNFIHGIIAFAVLATASLSATAQQPVTPAPSPGGLGTYYNNPNGSVIPSASGPGSPVVPNSTIVVLPGVQRIDSPIDFGDVEAVRPAGINNDFFQTTWLGTITCPTTGSYIFRINVDDGGRLWVSNTLPFAAAPTINSWIDQGPTNHDSGAMTLNAGDVLYFRFEFYEHGGGSAARLHWQLPGAAAFAVIPGFTAGAGLQTPGPCPTPALTAVSVPGAAQIQLNWTVPAATAAETPADSYNIYRGTVLGGAKVLVGNSATLTFTDTGAVGGPLAFGTTYYYVVQGVYSAGPTAGALGIVAGPASNEAPCAVNPFAITPLSLLVIENGGTGIITITTSAAIPLGVDVTFPITVTTVGGGPSFTVVSPAIMNGNNTVGQSLQVIVTGVPNQRANDPKTASIQFGPSQSVNAGFNNHTFPPITCTQIESDIPGVIIMPASGLAITNGGTAITFNVTLATIPDFDVTMTTSSTIPYAAVITPATLTFNAGNWNTGQTVTVTPNNVDTTLFYLTSFYVDFTPVTSADANYDGINPGRAYIFEATSTPPLQSVWGSSGCGLMGAEALLVLALAALRRRRRST